MKFPTVKKWHIQRCATISFAVPVNQLHVHPPVFPVLFVSRRCSRGSRRSFLFAPFPGYLCAPQARRQRRPPLCPSLLRTELSGTAFPRWRARRSSRSPVQAAAHSSLIFLRRAGVRVLTRNSFEAAALTRVRENPRKIR